MYMGFVPIGSRGLGGPRSLEKVPLRVEPEHPLTIISCPDYFSPSAENAVWKRDYLDEGTDWVVGRSTETVDPSPSIESMDSWAATPGTESVDLHLELQRMSLVYGTVPS